MAWHKQIVLADDDSEDREMILSAFEEIGVKEEAIVSVENGESVLRYLEHCKLDEQLPCLIILDLNMPRMNGTQTLQYLKKHDRFRHITVVIFSTSVNAIERETCLHLGAHSYITKPVL